MWVLCYIFMTMEKISNYSVKKIEALNTPIGWEIFNLPKQIKTASTVVVDKDLGGFDLKKAIKVHPDHLYVKIFAIRKDEPNDNADAFCEEELTKAAHTFI